MRKSSNPLMAAHEAFFENDPSNMAIAGVGFAISAVCILLVYALYPW